MTSNLQRQKYTHEHIPQQRKVIIYGEQIGSALEDKTKKRRKKKE